MNGIVSRCKREFHSRIEAAAFHRPNLFAIMRPIFWEEVAYGM